MLTLGVFGLLLVGTAAATVAQQTVNDRSLEDDQVGICHATGNEDQPFVYVVVDRGGQERDAHEEHENDTVDVDGPEECGITEPAADPADAQPASDAERDRCHENGGNNRSELSPCDGDLSVNKTGRIEGEHVFFDVVVQSLGPAEADAVKLVDRLPDLGRPWNMSGEDAASCGMVDREVRCDFGDLPAGEERSLRFKALHCPQDCGDDLTNTVIVHAGNDANEANDRATVVLTIDDCPDEDDWSWADESTPSPSPSPTQSSPNTTTEPNRTSTPSGNATSPVEPANSTAAAEPAPDVRVRQRATQDHLGVSFVIEVTSIGDAAAAGVLLQDTLPDVQRSWALSGEDAGDCTLDENNLTCRFGTLDSNESKIVELRAFTDRMPCGEHLVNTVVVTAEEDADATNDRSSASILARSC